MLRALERLGLVYEPDFSSEMITELACKDSVELHEMVGLGPSHERAEAHMQDGGGMLLLLDVFNVTDETRSAIEAAMKGEA